MTHEQNLVQGSPEWLAMRKKYIGASDCPIIMGVSPYKTPYQLFLEKLDLVEKQETTKAMQRGHDMEPEARAAFIELTGINVSPLVAFDKQYTWRMASLDGISEDGKNIVEIKCVNAVDHETAQKGGVPEKYIPQIQHQMAVCNLEKAYYYSYNGVNNALVIVPRDDDYVDVLTEKELEFWCRMQSFDPPPMTCKDYIYRDDKQWEVAMYQYNDAKCALVHAEACAEQAKQVLIDLAAGQSCKSEAGSLAMIPRRGAIQYDKIPELKNVDLEKFRKEKTVSWRINLK